MRHHLVLTEDKGSCHGKARTQNNRRFRLDVGPKTLTADTTAFLKNHELFENLLVIFKPPLFRCTPTSGVVGTVCENQNEGWCGLHRQCQQLPVDAVNAIAIPRDTP